MRRSSVFVKKGSLLCSVFVNKCTYPGKHTSDNADDKLRLFRFLFRFV